MNDEKLFNEKCAERLPENILVNGIKYKLCAHGLMAGGYDIRYGEFDGRMFNWDNQILRFIYNVVDVIPEKEEPLEDGWVNIGVNVTSIDGIMDDYLNKLNEIGYEKLDEIIDKDTMFYRDLTSLLNKYGKENISNTPDYILSSYLMGCLRNFNSTMKQRKEYYKDKN